MHRIPLFVQIPVVPGAEPAITGLAHGEFFQVKPLKLDEQFYATLWESRPCVILISVFDGSARNETFAFLKGLRHYCLLKDGLPRDPSMRIVLLAENHRIPMGNWVKLGVYEMLIAPMAPNAISYKLSRHFHKAIDASTKLDQLPHIEVNERTLVPVASSPHEKVYLYDPKDHPLPESMRAQPTEERVKKISLSINLPQIKPGRGKWKMVEDAEGFEDHWEWDEENPDPNQPPSKRKKLVYIGDEPEFDEGSGRWTFTGELPRLYKQPDRAEQPVESLLETKEETDGRLKMQLQPILDVGSAKASIYARSKVAPQKPLPPEPKLRPITDAPAAKTGVEKANPLTAPAPAKEEKERAEKEKREAEAAKAKRAPMMDPGAAIDPKLRPITDAPGAATAKARPVQGAGTLAAPDMKNPEEANAAGFAYEGPKVTSQPEAPGADQRKANPEGGAPIAKAGNPKVNSAPAAPAPVQSKPAAAPPVGKEGLNPLKDQPAPGQSRDPNAPPSSLPNPADGGNARKWSQEEKEDQANNLRVKPESEASGSIATKKNAAATGSLKNKAGKTGDEEGAKEIAMAAAHLSESLRKSITETRERADEETKNLGKSDRHESSFNDLRKKGEIEGGNLSAHYDDTDEFTRKLLNAGNPEEVIQQHAPDKQRLMSALAEARQRLEAKQREAELLRKKGGMTEEQRMKKEKEMSFLERIIAFLTDLLKSLFGV